MQITGKFENERLICNRMERLYLYKNSAQICAQTGFQGYVRGDFDNGGDRFFSDFYPLKSPCVNGFIDALQEVMDTLRDGILKSFTTMKDFCIGEGFDSRFQGNWTEEFAFRIDHNGFAFLFRLIPMRGDYHVYVHCYYANWLDQHMDQAEHGIRFIDSSYQEKFRLEDGGRIRITTLDGNVKERTCRYIDSYHVEVGDYLYHICEYGEMCETSGTKVDPVEGVNCWKAYNGAGLSITEFLGMTDAEFAEHNMRNISDEEYEKMLLKGQDDFLVRFADARRNRGAVTDQNGETWFPSEGNDFVPDQLPGSGEIFG